MLKLVILIIFFAITSSRAQTNVSGTLTSSVNWSVTNSPYILTGTLGVAPGVTLTIEPGVRVIGSYDLLVKGKVRINGTFGNRVRFENVRLIFKSTNLTESVVQFVDFADSGVQLADESEFVQDSPKNSGILNVSDSKFTNGGYARTKGYDSGAKLRISKCDFQDASITGYYPRSEIVEIDEANILSSVVFSESYNYGIYFANSAITNTSFLIGCCGANIQISNSTIVNSGFRGDPNTVVDGLLRFQQVEMNNSYVALPAAEVSIIGSTVNAISVSQPSLISIGNGEISDSSIEGYGGLTLVKVSGLSGYSVDKSVTFDKVNFKNFETALEIDNFKDLNIQSCNFVNSQAFNIRNLSNKDINAKGIYWGTTIESIIKDRIFDFYDDANYGIVDYSDFATQQFCLLGASEPCSLVTSIQETRNDMSIYPNPFQDRFSLESHSEGIFKIYDNMGALIKDGFLEEGSNEIDLVGHATGLYTCIFLYSGNTKVFRLFKY